MNEMHSILQRLNELAIQSANGTNADSDRSQIQLEVDELVDEIDRIADTTQFNAQNLLDGSFAYKAYTNSENVKVMSYTKEVSKGVYQINGLTYYSYGNETITYANGATPVINTDIDFKISSADDVKNALDMTGSVTGDITAFPESVRVSIDDEYFYISDDDGFEIKLYVNDRDNVTPATATGKTSVITTTSIPETALKIVTYKSIDVKDANGNEYNISSLIDNSEDGIYSDARTETFTSLEEDLGIENISKAEINGDKITVTYIDNSGQDQTIELSTINGETLDNGFQYSTSTREKTRYEITDAIKIDITKMGAMLVQTGANEGQQLEIEIPALNAINLGIDGLDISTEDNATEAIDIVGKAINQLSAVRSKIGAYTNRLEHTVANLETSDENLTSAYSRIMDADMAEEMTEYANQQVLVQAATSVLAQANERPQQVLQLLQ
jgi:flagellin